MTDTSKVFRFMRRAAARTNGQDDADDQPRELPARSEGVRSARVRLDEAMIHAHGGAEVPADARLRSFKQLIVTAARPITSHQGDFNRNVAGAVESLADEAERLAADLDRHEQQTKRLQAAAATTDLTIDDLGETVRRFGDDLAAAADTFATVRSELARIESLLGVLRSEVQTVRSRQDLIFRSAREAMPGGFDIPALSQLSRELSTGYEELYEDLEDTFRGSREHVISLARPYVADVEELPGSGPVVDVGCGRGEWLEVLRDAGIGGYGIDFNKVVVDRCVERGLDVREGDALTHLRDVPEGSVRAVTSFHVVEHLSLDTLVGLIDAALVALQPGGLLLFETPNPTNLAVGAASFYLDPTHLKPLHPQFLEFLVLSRGFADAEVRYLHEEDKVRLEAGDLAGDPGRAQVLADHVNWALFGPLDVAILARKAGAYDDASAAPAAEA
ncbi:MAG TPA: methyltransferase domain-containing protein [Acidimicrobiales bacterium]